MWVVQTRRLEQVALMTKMTTLSNSHHLVKQDWILTSWQATLPRWRVRVMVSKNILGTKEERVIRLSWKLTNAQRVACAWLIKSCEHRLTWTKTDCRQCVHGLHGTAGWPELEEYSAARSKLSNKTNHGTTNKETGQHGSTGTLNNTKYRTNWEATFYYVWCFL